MNGDLSFAAVQVDRPNFMLEICRTQSVGTVATKITDDDGNDTDPFMDDEDDGKSENGVT